MTPYGANTTFSPPGKVHAHHPQALEEEHGRHDGGRAPECRYVATVCASYAVEMMNKVRRALTIGGPTFIHSLDPCPKGWDYDPMLSHELGELAIETGIFPLYEVEDGRSCGTTARPRRSSRARRASRSASTSSSRAGSPTSPRRTSAYFQAKVDEMWNKWESAGRRPVLAESMPHSAAIDAHVALNATGS